MHLGGLSGAPESESGWDPPGSADPGGPPTFRGGGEVAEARRPGRNSGASVSEKRQAGVALGVGGSDWHYPAPLTWASTPHVGGGRLRAPTWAFGLSEPFSSIWEAWSCGPAAVWGDRCPGAGPGTPGSVWGARGVSAYCLTRVGLPECLPGRLGCLSFPGKGWVGGALPAPSPGSPRSLSRACSQSPSEGLPLVMDTLRAQVSKGARAPWTAHSASAFSMPRPCASCPGGPCPGEGLADKVSGLGRLSGPWKAGMPRDRPGRGQGGGPR